MPCGSMEMPALALSLSEWFCQLLSPLSTGPKAKRPTDTDRNQSRLKHWAKQTFFLSKIALGICKSNRKLTKRDAVWGGKLWSNCVWTMRRMQWCGSDSQEQGHYGHNLTSGWNMTSRRENWSALSGTAEKAAASTKSRDPPSGLKDEGAHRAVWGSGISFWWPGGKNVSGRFGPEKPGHSSVTEINIDRVIWWPLKGRNIHSDYPWNLSQANLS